MLTEAGCRAAKVAAAATGSHVAGKKKLLTGARAVPESRS